CEPPSPQKRPTHRMLPRTHPGPPPGSQKLVLCRFWLCFTMHLSLTIGHGQCAAYSPTLTSDEHRRRLELSRGGNRKHFAYYSHQRVCASTFFTQLGVAVGV